MARVLCSRPNAADEISGVQFTPHEGAMLSEVISDEQAAGFLEVPGYDLFEEEDVAATKAAAKAEAAKAEAAAKADAAEAEAEHLKKLTARATELGVEIKPSWKAPRLTAEIERAEAAAAEAKADADKAAAGKSE